MIKGIAKRLNQPFPSKRNLRSCVLNLLYVSIFIAGFLFVFKPFGMRHVANPFALSVAFGAVSLAFSISFELFCRFAMKVKTDVPSWTLRKWLVQSFLMVSWIALGNYLLQSVLFWGNFGSLKLWLEIWQATLTLGCFPVFVCGLVLQMQAVKNNVQQASEIDLPRQHSIRGPVIEFALSSNESYRVAAADILFVEAMQNYVQIHASDGHEVSRHVVRNTVANTLQQIQRLGVTSIIRCHRSYLVNIDVIGAVSGNAQGLKLTLNSSLDEMIPVSRSYIPEFKRVLGLAARPGIV